MMASPPNLEAALRNPSQPSDDTVPVTSLNVLGRAEAYGLRFDLVGFWHDAHRYEGVFVSPQRGDLGTWYVAAADFDYKEMIRHLKIVPGFKREKRPIERLTGGWHLVPREAG